MDGDRSEGWGGGGGGGGNTTTLMKPVPVGGATEWIGALAADAPHVRAPSM